MNIASVESGAERAAIKAVYKSFKCLDDLISALVWGWGSRVRYYNMFCYEIWMVFERT